MLLLVHPLVQILALGVALYALRLGWARFAAAHLGAQGRQFDWRGHVRAGTAAMLAWILAAPSGLGAAWAVWDGVFMTGRHAWVGLAMLPLALFGLGSGLYMDRVKAPRKTLPLAHGLANALLALLALHQLVTGAMVLKGELGG